MVQKSAFRTWRPRMMRTSEPRHTGTACHPRIFSLRTLRDSAMSPQSSTDAPWTLSLPVVAIWQLAERKLAAKIDGELHIRRTGARKLGNPDCAASTIIGVHYNKRLRKRGHRRAVKQGLTSILLPSGKKIPAGIFRPGLSQQMCRIFLSSRRTSNR